MTSYKHIVNAPRFPKTRSDGPGPGAFDAKFEFIRPRQPVGLFGRPSLVRSQSCTDDTAFSAEISTKVGMSSTHSANEGSRDTCSKTESVFGRPLYGLFHGVPRQVDYWSMQRTVRNSGSPRRIQDTPQVSQRSVGGAHTSIQRSRIRSVPDFTRKPPQQALDELRTKLKGGHLDSTSHRQLFQLVTRPTLKDAKMTALKESLKDMRPKA